MEADTPTSGVYSHSEYFDAFQQFMQTGEKNQLAPYLENSRPEVFLSVYRNGFIRASSSALESNFSSLVKLWGEDYFAQVAAAYVNVAAPSSATLIGYGFEKCLDVSNDSVRTVNLEKGFDNDFEKQPEELNFSFIAFLEKNLKEVLEQYPYVLDLCRLDQAWLESLNENGESFLTLPAVQDMIAQGIDLGELPLRLVDSSRIVKLEFDIFELWGQLRFGELTEGQSIELKVLDNSVVFWQSDLQVQAKPLSELEAVFMKSLKLSEDFDIATNQAVEKDENFEVSTLFAELLNANLLQQ